MKTDPSPPSVYTEEVVVLDVVSLAPTAETLTHDPSTPDVDASTMLLLTRITKESDLIAFFNP